MVSKLRIKFGELEVECEGSEDFLKEEFKEIIGIASELRKFNQTQTPVRMSDSKSGVLESAEVLAANSRFPSIRDLAVKSGAKTGPKLAELAAVRLTLGEGKAEFNRLELLNEMKRATGKYTANMGKNLSPTLDALIKADVIVGCGNNKYAMTPEAIAKAQSDCG